MTIGAPKLESLNSHRNSVYGLDLDLNIVYQNPAPINFSEENSRNNWQLIIRRINHR
jgi:hypothetical protein